MKILSWDVLIDFVITLNEFFFDFIIDIEVLVF